MDRDSNRDSGRDSGRDSDVDRNRSMDSVNPTNHDIPKTKATKYKNLTHLSSQIRRTQGLPFVVLITP